MSAVDDAKKYLSLRPPMENKTIFALHPDVLVGGLLDEIERLREALESFSCECETEDDCCAVTGSFCGWEACAALKEGDGPERCICPSH